LFEAAATGAAAAGEAATAAAGAAAASDFLETRLAADEAVAAEAEAVELFLLIVLRPVEVFDIFKRTMPYRTGFFRSIL
jgi:hypothetical protein